MNIASSCRNTARGGLFGAVLAGALGVSAEAGATPGTHPPLVATWNSTASSVTGAFTTGTFGGGHLDFASFTSAWSSSSGNVSGQFGLHYANYGAPGEASAMHGGAGTAALVFSTPALGRHANGVPRAAIGFYVGAAPTALIGGEHDHIWAPLAVGLSVPLSPLRFITLVPWFEAAGGVTFDAVIKAPDVTTTLPKALVNPRRPVAFTQTDVNSILAQYVHYDLAGAATLRGGLSLAVHLGAADLGLGVSLGNVGKLGGGAQTALFSGGSLTLRWDDVVPAALPPRARLERETCEDVRERLTSCPLRAPPVAP